MAKQPKTKVDFNFDLDATSFNDLLDYAQSLIEEIQVLRQVCDELRDELRYANNNIPDKPRAATPKKKSWMG